ncbi:MAG: stage V sporulation protein S [Candidatus Meridianibacter frigidus]|nr:MAG: stage V sporulation protein S [Candidatus Eremiobacteraeota bacterium]
MITHLRSEHVTTGILKVSAKSNPNSVAGALAAVLREHESAELQAVGAGAINQAVKAIAIARSYLKSSSFEISCVPSFIGVEINGTERTGMSLAVHRRPL